MCDVCVRAHVRVRVRVCMHVCVCMGTEECEGSNETYCMSIDSSQKRLPHGLHAMTEVLEIATGPSRFRVHDGYFLDICPGCIYARAVLATNEVLK